MLHGSGLPFEVANNYQFFLGNWQIKCNRFCGFGSADDYKSLRMMLCIFVLFYLFFKKDRLSFILGSVMP